MDRPEDAVQVWRRRRSAAIRHLALFLALSGISLFLGRTLGGLFSPGQTTGLAFRAMTAVIFLVLVAGALGGVRSLRQFLVAHIELEKARRALRLKQLRSRKVLQLDD